MNYPIWELNTVDGGTWIAIIAIFHTYIAHLAVGGGLLLWWTDRRATARGDRELLGWVRSHTKFFLLLTMVAGGVTGVGIWFIIGLVHPEATSLLIHTFVFGWAIEWVFFVVEIVALLVYHARFDSLAPKTRQTVALLYALAAWLSLVIINGILAFMLTPGRWLETGGFWDGFFNPSYLSSTVLRTFIAMTIAGLFALITGVAIADPRVRQKIVRYASRWILLPLAGLIPAGWWYLSTIPEGVRERVFVLNPEAAAVLPYVFIGGAFVISAGLVLMVRLPRAAQALITAIAVLAGFSAYGGFEYLREMARKPYVIQSVMYSNGLLPGDLEVLNRDGVLAHAKWTAVREVTPENRLAAGRELYNIQCLRCHTAGGIHNDIIQRTSTLTVLGAEAVLEGLGTVHDYMPPFMGTDAERNALAAYLVGTLGARSLEVEEWSPAPRRDAPKPAQQDLGDHVLLAWNDLGMHCISDSDPWFVILPPANTIEAQLLRRGETPELVTEGVTLRYAVEEQHRNPDAQSRFWEHSEALLGAPLEHGVGLKGKGVMGIMDPAPARGGFIAELIPVTPYRDDGGINPYPLVTIEARDASTGALLATTQVVTPTSTEMGCRSCHGGAWSHGTAGVSDETARNILALHDRDNGTDLLAAAEAGSPRFCASCHGDPATGMEGEAERLSLSAAIHGWHAVSMPLKGQAACQSCHPAKPSGGTRCLRGLHGEVGLACTDCHGSLDEHAASLLKGEGDKASVPRLLSHLEPSHVASLEEIKPRRPWVQQPDCLSCHVNFEAPETDTSFNLWTADGAGLYRNRTDETGLRCEACHGAPHALYPANNPWERHRDNLQPLTLTGAAAPIGAGKSCTVCHIEEMEDPPHHANMMDQ